MCWVEKVPLREQFMKVGGDLQCFEAAEGNSALWWLYKGDKHFPASSECGATEDDCIKRDIKFKKALTALSRVPAAAINGFEVGFVKMLATKQGKLLGATIVAPEAELIIQEIAVAIRHNLSIVDLASTPCVKLAWSELIRNVAKKLA